MSENMYEKLREQTEALNLQQKPENMRKGTARHRPGQHHADGT